MQIEIVGYHLILTDYLLETLREGQVSIEDTFLIPKCVIVSLKEVCVERQNAVANWMLYW